MLQWGRGHRRLVVLCRGAKDRREFESISHSFLTRAIAAMFHDARDRFKDISDRTVAAAKENPWLAAGVGISVLVGGLLVSGSSKDYKRKPGTGSLSGGGIKRDNVKRAYSDYHDSYGQGAGEGITDRSKTTGVFMLLHLLNSKAANIASLDKREPPDQNLDPANRGIQRLKSQNHKAGLSFMP